jgi:membrane protease YdiL (CAAX protease family)
MSKDSSSPDVPTKGIAKTGWLHRRTKKTDLGSPYLIIANVLVIFVVSQVFAAFIVQLALAAAKVSSTSISSSAGAEFLYVLLAEGLAAGFAIYLVKRRGLSLHTIGLGRRPNKKDVYKAGLGFLAFYGLLIIAGAILGLFYPDLNKGTQDVGFNNLNTSLDTLLAFFALVFLPPLGEEVLVRGYLYSGLRQKMRYLPALLITSLFFGAAHLPGGTDTSLLWAAGLNTFVLSVVLVYLRENTGMLYAGMMVHMLNNLIAFGFHFHV